MLIIFEIFWELHERQQNGYLCFYMNIKLQLKIKMNKKGDSPGIKTLEHVWVKLKTIRFN